MEIDKPDPKIPPLETHTHTQITPVPCKNSDKINSYTTSVYGRDSIDKIEYRNHSVNKTRCITSTNLRSSANEQRDKEIV